VRSIPRRLGFWETKGVGFGDRLDRDGTEDEAVLVHDRQLFFPLLLVMAGVADALALFF
jgi:hypothetical protein